MHHRRADEAQAVRAQGKDVAFLDALGAAFQGKLVKELRQHLQRLGAGDQGQAREGFERPFDQGRMIRFQVMDHQIIRLAAIQGLREPDFPGLALAGVDRVQDGDSFVQDEVGVVRDAFGQDILALEEVEIEVVNADVFDAIVEGLDHAACFFCCTNIGNNRDMYLADYCYIRSWNALFLCQGCRCVAAARGRDRRGAEPRA